MDSLSNLVNSVIDKSARGPVPPRAPDRRLEKKLLHFAGRAIAQFEMIAPGDRILVGISGGKDSFTLLHVLQLLQQRSPVPFELIAVNLDQGHPGFPAAQLEAYLHSQNVPVKMLRQDTYSIVQRLVPEGEVTCPLCSRLRRGILYNAAESLSCTKIALGHHRDDLIESLLLSMLFSGKLRSMPPKLASNDGRNTVIRPLCLSTEDDIRAFSESAAHPIIPCDLCGSQENLQRQRVKKLLAELEKDHPGVRDSLLASMANVMPEHLLDLKLRARGDRSEAAGGDPWLDEEEGCSSEAKTEPELLAIGLKPRAI
jgi:tRNA 2-thiocytidine biosynthesis protein TtcA